MRQFAAGEVIRARGRDWTVVIPPEGGVDLLVAEPHPRDDERRAISVYDQAVARGKLSPIAVVSAQRSVLDLDEIEQ